MRRLFLWCALSAFLFAAVCMADDWAVKRQRLVDNLKGQGIANPRVLAAMAKVPRHLFVPTAERELAYADMPLPIGYDQTISQPYIVGFMTQALELKGGEKVLEIGTGSGYQAAVLAETAKEVYSIEIVCELAARADKQLQDLGYKNVNVKCGDGYRGWPDAAPFDAVIVTAAPDHVPQPLVDQLKVGGVMVIPVGRGSQDLLVIRKNADGVVKKSVLPVLFVPMTGPGVSQPR